MRAFLSHSSVDKDIVIVVHDGLQANSTWLDRAEIEWGELFLEKIAEGIASATDFVLFWSVAAARSEWVRIEINMAFIQALRSKAIRLRVILLDETPLPLYLQPYHVFSVAGSASPAADILQKLAPLLREPVRSARSRFVNRHHEIGRIEAAVDDPEFRTIWTFGFIGVGKTSLIQEALNRIFEGADVAHLDIGQGTGFVELALELSALSRHETLPVGLDQAQIESDIRLSLEVLAKDGRLLLLSNVQHWLNEDGEPQGPLPFILAVAQSLKPFEKRPLFLTSTRRPSLDATALSRLTLFRISGLRDEHIATLVRNWHFSIHDRELSTEDAKLIAPKLHGHPVAARLAAGLLGDRTVSFLEEYPQEIISLQRDLARVLLQGLNLGIEAERLMEMLALAGVSLPASVIVSAGFSEEEFQYAVARCADAGLLTADLTIETHPLFREFFWHRLHRGDYQTMAMKLANSLKAYLEGLDKASPEFASLLPVAFRSYAMAGDLDQANALRRDLSGELESTAITLYHRRNYELADTYIQHLLDENPANWRMRLYRARIRIRQEEWKQAETLLAQMLAERPDDVGVLHVMGRSQLRQHHLPEALELFTRVVARREHVASLRDAAECLHRLNRSEEALRFLERAKRQESENPFVLDLESRIFEDRGQLELAFESALLASARDPMNAYMHNRLGIIRVKLRSPGLAIAHFQRAMDIDHDLFSAANSLGAAYLDTGDVAAAERLFPELQARAHTPSDSHLLRHTEARIAYSRKDFEQSREILKGEIAAGYNVVPNLGLLVGVEFALFDQNVRDFPTIAALSLKQAEAALARIVALDRSNEFIDTLRSQLEERQKGIVRSSNASRTPVVRGPSTPAEPRGSPAIPANSVPGVPPQMVPGRPQSKSASLPDRPFPNVPRSKAPEVAQGGKPGGGQGSAAEESHSKPLRKPVEKKPALKPPLKPPLRLPSDRR
jgi:tetratricopeptide (TPR) repeat protein